MFKKIVNNLYFLSMLKKLNTIVFGMLATIFLNRALGPSLKGEYATILNIISTLTNILYLGISTIYPNYVRNREKWTDSTFFALVFAQGLVYGIISIMVSAITRSLPILLYGFCITFAVVSMQILQMSIINDFKRGTIANIISVTTNALLLFFMWFFKIKNVDIAFGIYMIKEITIIVFSLSIIRKTFNFKDVDRTKWLKIIATGIVPMITNLLIILNYKVDVIILQFLKVDYYQIGLYSTALALAEYGWIVSDVFKDVLIKKTSSEDNIDTIAMCLRISSTALLIIGVVLAITSKLLLTLLYGKEYSEAWIITDVIFIGVFSMSYCKLLIPLYLANGRWKFYFWVLFGATSINIVTNFILIPLWGIYGAAFTSIVSYSFAGILFATVFMKEYHVKVSNILIVKKSDIHNLKVAFKRIKSKA